MCITIRRFLDKHFLDKHHYHYHHYHYHYHSSPDRSRFVPFALDYTWLTRRRPSREPVGRLKSRRLLAVVSLSFGVETNCSQGSVLYPVRSLQSTLAVLYPVPSQKSAVPVLYPARSSPCFIHNYPVYEHDFE